VWSIHRCWRGLNKPLRNHWNVRQHTADLRARGWFTEGFTTADLQEAKALLEELA
jgi:hypothetical protein